MLHLKKSTLSFGNNKSHFHKHYHYSPLDPEEKRFGELFAVIEIQDGSSAEVVADTIFETLRENYYAMEGKDSGTAFEKALGEVNATLNNIVPKKGKSKNLLDKINAILIVKSGNALHITQVGEAEAHLLREGKIFPISEELGDAKMGDNVFVNIASGDLHSGDRLFFSTGKVSGMISRPELLRTMKNTEFDELESEFGDMLDAMLDEDRNLTMSFLEMSDSDEVDIPVKFLRPISPDSSILSKIRYFLSKNAPTWKNFLTENFHVLRSRADNMRRQTDKRTATFAFGVMLLALVVAVIVVWNKKSETQVIAEFQQDYSVLREDLAKAERLVLYDKPSAENLLLQIRTDLEELKKVGRFAAQLEVTETSVNDAMDRVFNIDRVFDPILIAELGNDSDAPAKGLVFDGEKWHAFNSNNWYSIILDEVTPISVTKADEILFGDYSEFSDITQLYTKGNQIIEVRGKNVGRPTITGDIFPRAVDLKTYSRNTYFLDPVQNQIWKSRKDDDGAMLSPAPYITGENIDVSGGISMAIDGSVWVLTSDGSIINLLRGVQEEFEVKGVPEEIKKPTKIFTTFDSPNLYVLESPKNQVTVIRKESGEYLGSYIFENTGEIQDIYVSDETMKIYAVDETKVWSINL